MKKVCSCFLIATIFLGATPALAQDIDEMQPIYPQNTTQESEVSTELRRGPIFYTETLSNDCISVDVTYGLTSENKIISINSLGKVRCSDGFYSGIVDNATVVGASYSLDRKRVEFRVQFTAETTKDPYPGYRYETLILSI